MPIPTLTTLPPNPSFTDLAQKLNRLIQDYNNTLLNLDSINVVSLTADHIDAGTINGNVVTIRSDLTTGYIQIDGNGMVVNNGSFNTFTVDINGNVTMTSATIQSQNGYPRVVMDPNNDLFGAYLNANNYISIQADYAGTPSLNFFTALGIQGRIDATAGFEILNASTVNPMNIDGGVPGALMGGTFTFDNWSSILNSSGSVSLQTALNDKATAGVSTGLSGGHNHGIPDGTVLMVDGGGTVTFFSVGQHSHSQT